MLIYTIVVKEKKSVKEVMKVVKDYCSGSGSKINEDKNGIYEIGKAMVLMDCFNFKEVEEIRILGVLMGGMIEKVRDEMWGATNNRYREKVTFLETEKFKLKGEEA